MSLKAKGGITKGKSHAEGGMPMVVKSTGQKVELEGGEGVINKKNMADTQKHEFEGKMLTKCEIASEINSDGGNGVEIDCDGIVGKKYKHQDGGRLAEGGEIKELSDKGVVWDNIVEFAFKKLNNNLVKNGYEEPKTSSTNRIFSSIAKNLSKKNPFTNPNGATISRDVLKKAYYDDIKQTLIRQNKYQEDNAQNFWINFAVNSDELKQYIGGSTYAEGGDVEMNEVTRFVSNQMIELRPTESQLTETMKWLSNNNYSNTGKMNESDGSFYIGVYIDKSEDKFVKLVEYLNSKSIKYGWLDDVEFKVGEEVGFDVPYFESFLEYRGKIIGDKGSYLQIEYYEPLYDKMNITDVDYARVYRLSKFAKGGKVSKEYKVFNYTDNIYASNQTYNSVAEANKFIKDFRKRFEVQGYYRDNRRNKISPEHIDLEVIDETFSPYGFAKGGSVIGIQDPYELENQGNRYLESQGIDAKKFGVVHYDSFGKNSKLLKDVKGKDDEGNLNPLWMYERTPETKSMTKGFQRGKKIYEFGGLLNMKDRYFNWDVWLVRNEVYTKDILGDGNYKRATYPESKFYVYSKNGAKNLINTFKSKNIEPQGVIDEPFMKRIQYKFESKDGNGYTIVFIEPTQLRKSKFVDSEDLGTLTNDYFTFERKNYEDGGILGDIKFDVEEVARQFDAIDSDGTKYEGEVINPLSKSEKNQIIKAIKNIVEKVDGRFSDIVVDDFTNEVIYINLIFDNDVYDNSPQDIILYRKTFELNNSDESYIDHRYLYESGYKYANGGTIYNEELINGYEWDVSNQDHKKLPNRAIRFNKKNNRYELYNYTNNETDYSYSDLDDLVRNVNNIMGETFSTNYEAEKDGSQLYDELEYGKMAKGGSVDGFDETWNRFKENTREAFGQPRNNNIVRLESDFGFKKSELPQLRTNDKPMFVKSLISKYGANVVTEGLKVKASQLKPIQNEINLEQVEVIANVSKGKMNPNKPITISQDGYVIDGHHRWYYAKQNDLKLSVLQINLNAMQVIDEIWQSGLAKKEDISSVRKQNGGKI